MYLVYLLFMGLILGFVAYPLARNLGWKYGRFGRSADMLVVIVATITGGLLFTVLASTIGASMDENVDALVGGFVGALIAIIALVIFSLKAASDEPNQTKEPLPGDDTPA